MERFVDGRTDGWIFETNLLGVDLITSSKNTHHNIISHLEWTWQQSKNRSKNFDTRPHCGGRWFFMTEKLMRHRPVRSNAVSCSSRTNAVIAVLALYTTAATRTAFQWTRQPLQCPLSLGSGDMHPHLIHGPLGPPTSPTKRHLHPFSCCCRAHNGVLRPTQQKWVILETFFTDNLMA